MAVSRDQILKMVGLVLIVVIAYYVFRRFVTNKYREEGVPVKSSWTVYGTDECGWTRKQLKEMDDKGVDYSYVNCKNGDCGDIKSYPTLKNDAGETKVGFTTF
jgi:hypothetical protein